MEFSEIVSTIKDNTEYYLDRLCDPAKGKANGRKSWICPLCGHGTHGDGLTIDPHTMRQPGKTPLVKCFGCGFSGSVIDLYMMRYKGTTDDREAFFDTVQSMGGLMQLPSIHADAPSKPSTDARNSSGNHVTQTTKPAAPSKPSTDAPGRPSTSHTSPKEKAAADLTEPEQATQETPKETPTTTGTKPTAPAGGRYADYIRECVARVDTVRDYLHGRGLNDETIDKFKLGYDPRKYFPSAGESRPAIIYPYSGSFDYYGARDLERDHKKHHFDKPSTKDAGAEPVYNAADLYGGPSDVCFVCEGAFDALTIRQNDFSAVAIGGSGPEKLRTKNRERPIEKPLILAFDDDEKGQRTRDNTAALLDDIGVFYRVASFDENGYDNIQADDDRDPNSLYNANPFLFPLDLEKMQADALAAASRDDLDDFLAEIYTHRYEPTRTGIKSLDAALDGGLISQTFTIIAGPPGSGKTVFAAEIAEGIAADGRDCIYINLEMSRAQLYARSVAKRVYKADHTHKLRAIDVLRGYTHTPTEKQYIADAVTQYRHDIGDRLIYNPPNISNDLDEILNYIDAAGTKARDAGKPGPVVVVDYLQLIDGRDREDDIHTIKRAVKGLKDYAIKYDTIVIGLSAQNRTANKSKKADMTGLRDTSNLEYSADLILQLVPADDDLHPVPVTLYVTKSRFTATDTKTGLWFAVYGGQSFIEQVKLDETGFLSPAPTAWGSANPFDPEQLSFDSEIKYDGDGREQAAADNAAVMTMLIQDPKTGKFRKAK